MEKVPCQWFDKDQPHGIPYRCVGTDQRFAKKIGERTLFVTHGESCSKVSVDAQGSISSSTVFELCSNQEEADTRVFLHALHASDVAHQQIKSSHRTLM